MVRHWPYYAILLPTSISAFFSSLMILFILSDSKRSRQFYQLLCLILAIADIIQCSSWWIAHKFHTTVEICTIQEYMLQGSSLIKATVTVILSSVTLYIVKSKQRLTKKQFILHCLFWMTFPIICLPLSIYFKTSATYCRELKDFSKILAYGLTILLPFVCFIIVNTIIFIFIRRSILKSLKENIMNPYEKTLLHLSLKLNSYPIVFSVCWSVEIIAVFIHVIFHKSDSIINFIGIILISLTGTGISWLYFLYEWNAIGPFLYYWKCRINQYFYPDVKNTDLPLNPYTSSVYREDINHIHHNNNKENIEKNHSVSMSDYLLPSQSPEQQSYIIKKGGSMTTIGTSSSNNHQGSFIYEHTNNNNTNHHNNHNNNISKCASFNEKPTPTTSSFVSVALLSPASSPSLFQSIDQDIVEG